MPATGRALLSFQNSNGHYRISVRDGVFFISKNDSPERPPADSDKRLTGLTSLTFHQTQPGGGRVEDYLTLETGDRKSGDKGASTLEVSERHIAAKLWLRTFLFAKDEVAPESEDRTPVVLELELAAQSQEGDSAVIRKEDFSVTCWGRKTRWSENDKKAHVSDLHTLGLFRGKDGIVAKELGGEEDPFRRWTPRLFEIVGVNPPMRLSGSRLRFHLLENGELGSVKRRLCIIRDLIYDDFDNAEGSNSVHVNVLAAQGQSELSVRVPAPGPCSLFEVQLAGGHFNGFGSSGTADFQFGSQRLVGLTNVPKSAMIEMWNRDIVEPYERALRTVRGERPHSFLPKWHGMTRTVLAEPVQVSVLYLAEPDDPDDASVAPKLKLTHPFGTVIPDNIFDLWNGDNAKALPRSIQVQASFPRFRSHNNEPLRALIELSADRSVHSMLKEWMEPVRPEPLTGFPVLSYASRVVDDPAPSGDPRAWGNVSRRQRTVRLGAFDLTLGGAPPVLSRDPVKEPRWVLGYVPELQNGMVGHALHMDLNLRLGLEGFVPAAQDETEFEQLLDADEYESTERPLVIPMTPTVHEKLLLSVNEKANRDERQRLQLFVQAKKEAAIQAQPVLVVDSEPLLVAKVDFPVLGGTETSWDVAVYDSDSVEGAGWQLKINRQKVDIEGRPLGEVNLTLPPQVLGESMEKGKGDAFKNDEDFADFRFGRPTLLSLWTTWRSRERSFGEPPHNLRRIFGDATQRAPGAPLESADIELLYGLKARLEAGGDLLVSELTAEFGLLPSLLPKTAIAHVEDTGEYEAFQKGWLAVHKTFQRRLAVLSVRTRAGEAAKISKGVQMELRRKAETRAPVMLLPGDFDPATKVLPYDDEGKRADLPTEDLLPGGAEWGFESGEIYRSVWKTHDRFKAENVGLLENVHFSALGGWGQQKAYFDRGKTAIISHTNMGRTHYYSLERVGRIARYWHRAKHVIVYERTVLPSEQFEGHQSNLYGRAVPRKVKEFVEIQVPLRRYPEDGKSKRECGCIEGCEFRTVVIPVDSSWGEDLPGVGWRVPLWNQQAYKKKPNVYPKPQIGLRITRRTESGFGVALDDIADPENVWFFTSTNPDHDDNTDAWGPILDVDFVDLPPPAPETGQAIQSDAPDGQLASARPVLAGWALMTNRLEGKGGFAAELMSGRATGDAPSAVLRTVTMVRAVPAVAEDPILKDHAKVLEMAHDVIAAPAEEVERAARRLQTLVRDKVITSAVQLADEVAKLETNPAVENAKRQLNDIKLKITNVAAQLGDPCKLLEEKVKTAIPLAVGVLQENLQGQKDGLLTRLLMELSAVEAQTTDQRLKAERLINAFFDRTFMLFDTLSNPLNLVRNGVKELPTEPLQTLLDQHLAAFRKQVLDVLRQDDDRLREAADSFEARILAEFDRVADAALRTVGERLPRASERLAEVIAKARGSLRTKLREARTSIEDFLNKVGGITKEKVIEKYEELAKVATLFDKELTNLRDDVAAGLKFIDDALAERKTKLLSVRETVWTLLAEPEIRWPELREALNRGIDALFADLTATLVAKANESLGAVCATLLKDSDGPLALIQKAIDQLDGGWQALSSAMSQQQTLNEALRMFENGIDGTVPSAAAIARTAERAGEWVVGAVREFNKTAQLAQAPHDVLVMVRAFGDAPVVPALNFNRPQIAYYFSPFDYVVKTTPVTALVDRAGLDLKSFGMRLPIDGLGNDFVPKLPEPFSLSTLFPDFAGVKLDGLFPGLSAPKEVRDKVKVTHGFDREARRGWLQANVDGLEIGAQADLFSLGPIAVSLRAGRFNAEARIEAGAGGGMNKRVTGEIVGNWSLAFGGSTIVEFVKTPLVFNERGQFKFDLRPENVRLQGALNMLEPFLSRFSALGDNSSGLKITFLRENGIPVGVDCLLDIELPPMTFGAFGISGLRFGAGMHVKAIPDFEVGARLYLGTKKTPFTLTIFILGGSGFIVGRAWYRPFKGELYAEIEVFLAVSATLGFAFGPIRGSVAVYAGVHATMVARSRSGSRYTVGLLILICGEVSLFGLVTACIQISLEASVESGKRVVGHGQVSVTVKLGFLKKSFSKSLTYTLAGGGDGVEGLSEVRVLAMNDIATRHIAMLV